MRRIGQLSPQCHTDSFAVAGSALRSMAVDFIAAGYGLASNHV
jgi:hypothetical protein